MNQRSISRMINRVMILKNNLREQVPFGYFFSELVYGVRLVKINLGISTLKQFM